MLFGVHVIITMLVDYYFYPPPPRLNRKGVGWGGILNRCVTVCPSVFVSGLCTEDISWIAQPFVTRRCMVVQPCEPECCPKIVGCYLQGLGHSAGWYNQNMTLSTRFSKLMIRLKPNLLLYLQNFIYTIDSMRHHYMSVCLMKGVDYSMLCQGYGEGSELHWINECLSRPVSSVPLVSLHNLAMCVDVLMLIIRTSANYYVGIFTDNNNVTCNI